MPPKEITEGNPLQMLLWQRIQQLEARDGVRPSNRYLADRSGKRRDGQRLISPTTINNIMRGYTVKVSDETITGLATAFELDEATVRAAVAQASVKIALPPRAQKLSPQAWEEVLKFIDFQLTRQNSRRR